MRRRLLVKPIETVYRGYRFRSRLEARWAVFFDALDLEWEYEPEGFELDSGRYLPDFVFNGYIEGIGETRQFVEIKGRRPTNQEIRLADELAKTDGSNVLILEGSPLRATIHRFPAKAPYDRIEDNPIGHMAFFAWGFTSFTRRYTYAEVLAAATSAAQARFEFGQVGAPSNWTRAPA